jgi:ABC-2 type transport system permease protein
LLGCIIANATGGMSWTFYPLTDFFIVVGLSLFIGLLITLIGMLFSLHASTVRQVQLSISYCMIGTGFLFSVLLSQLRNLPFLSTKSFQSLNSSEILLLVIVGIAVIDIVLMLIALARFQRSRLILD